MSENHRFRFAVFRLPAFIFNRGVANGSQFFITNHAIFRGAANPGDGLPAERFGPFIG